MNKAIEFLKGKRTYGVVAISLLYLLGSFVEWWKFDGRVFSGFGLLSLVTMRMGIKDELKRLIDLLPLVLVAGLATFVLVGCVQVDPEADAFVVQVERTQASAAASFDLVLAVDDVDRPFWRTNAPGFHGFCEWLRQPLTYASPEYGPTNVARVLMMQLQVDDLKGAYVSGKGSSNALWGALQVLDQALIKAREWEAVIIQEGAKAARAN